MTLDRKTFKPYSLKGGAAAPKLIGIWKNELGSTMEITSFDGTTFAGTYTSAVSSNSTSAKGKLAGTLSGTALGFTATWTTPFSSVTSWSGLLLTDGNLLAIFTLWHLASTPDSDADLWESILAGADFFVRI
ncbi:MAG TPA: avidin/streptavidin family protein [Candidatus Dormibacteraeota bacterium]|nr:avidin/streptavidin family protein [Candidatus Dormibacteraeota bacterium]